MSYQFDNFYVARDLRHDPLGVLIEARRQRAIWLATGVSKASKALARLVHKAWTWYSARQVRVAAMAELRGLDDRMLKDIGITRGDIEAAVKGELRHVGPRSEATNGFDIVGPLTAASSNKARQAA